VRLLDRMRRIGVLIVGFTEDEPQIKARLTTFREGLERHGWSEGNNVRIDARFVASRTDRVQAIAKELIALPADIIVAHTTPAAAALQRETRAIPVVFVAVADPVGAGLVVSLARPGGNLTGFLTYETSVSGKWLAMLKEIAPHLARVALVANPKTSPYDYFLRTAQALAQSLAIELVPNPVETAVDIERTIEFFARVPNGGLMMIPDTTTAAHRGSHYWGRGAAPLARCLLRPFLRRGRWSYVLRDRLQRPVLASGVLRRPHPARR
jgi:putative tryptophan/tyrosine transport system substrate-binding protein